MLDRRANPVQQNSGPSWMYCYAQQSTLPSNDPCIFLPSWEHVTWVLLDTKCWCCVLREGCSRGWRQRHRGHAPVTRCSESNRQLTRSSTTRQRVLIALEAPCPVLYCTPRSSILFTRADCSAYVGTPIDCSMNAEGEQEHALATYICVSTQLADRVHRLTHQRSANTARARPSYFFLLTKTPPRIRLGPLCS